MASTKADSHLAAAYESLNLTGATDAKKYASVYEIRDHLQQQNQASTIPGNTTGTITERICELALRAAATEVYFRLPRRWQWIGDFYVLGEPFNTVISVKSFTVKERLLVSGSGNLLSPTIGFGLFKDPTEFGSDRLEQYKYRAFLAIYVPEDQLLSKVDDNSRKVENINGRRLLRPLEQFPIDLANAIRGTGVTSRLDPMGL